MIPKKEEFCTCETKGAWHLTPLGGLDQIGSNMILIEGNEGSSIIDCGILFPFEDTFKIRYLIPDFQHISRPHHVFITHGHEDHIGALGHLCEKFPGLHIIAPAFSAALIRDKLQLYSRKLKFKLEVQKESRTYHSSGLLFDYVRVNHSIPDTYGLHITDKKKRVGLFYVSDFKVDLMATHEPPFDFKKLKKLREGLIQSTLMADSTNITSSLAKTPSETELIPAFDSIFSRDYKRVFVTTFSSNIHRVVNIIESSLKAQRKVVLYGRAVKKYFNAAQDIDLIPENLKTYDVSEVDIEKERLTIIVSGCQGDFRGAFRRISFGQDTHFTLDERDCFVLSSKSIPGNEKKISLCLNKISQSKCDIITSSDELIHASGHAGKEDLKSLFENYSPDCYIPVHGEAFFLERHGQWIKEESSRLKVKVVHNHDTFDVFKQEIMAEGASEGEHLPRIIYGNAHELDRKQIRERRKIAEGGFLNIVISSIRSKLLFDIFHTGISFPQGISEDEVLLHIERIIKKNHKKNKDNSEQMRIEIRKLITQLIGERPVVRVSYLVSPDEERRSSPKASGKL